MLIDELHAQKEHIEALVKSYGAERIRIFISVARREEHANSDVDFLVALPKGYDLFKQRLP